MTSDPIVQPSILPVNQLLQEYTNSPEFLINDVWKIAFSPCSQYLAIPKQHVDGHYCVLVIYCSNWHVSNVKQSDMFVHNQFVCTTAVWSLAFGKRTTKSNIENNPFLLDKNLSSTIKTRRGSLDRRSSLSTVNRRYDFRKNLFLAVGLADGKINIWDINTGELTLVLKDHHSVVCGLDFSPFSIQLASCSRDTTIKLWDLLDDGNMYKTLNEWTHSIRAVKWSPDETLLCAVGEYELVVLFDTTTWKKLFRLDGHLHTVVDCAFSSDSAFLLTASYDTCVLMWSTVTGEMIKSFANKLPKPLKIYAGGDNGAFVRSIAIANFNQILITSCDDNKVRWFPLVSERSSNRIYEQTEHHVLSVAITPDGQTIAVSYRNGEVHLFSTLITSSTSQPLSLKSFCRLTINGLSGMNRKEILKLSLPRHLINYLLYKSV